ncbi:hypothetical protein I315_05166 [Cryptococcus gattii Ru294]|nr:hypothetical protein I315_05166 [Cryptococcus gattii Ru294]
MSGIRPKRLSAASSLVKRSSMMMIGESGGGGSGDEHVGLKRKDDGLNKTVAVLRSRVLELENSIDHCTNPEVEKLTKEVSTLEDLLDLLEETQRDNEAKHAENERQKQYVKDLENLLTELAGPHWYLSSKRAASKLHHRSSSTLNLAALGMTLPKRGYKL